MLFVYNATLNKDLSYLILSYLILRSHQLARPHFDGLGQDYANSYVIAPELLQSCTKPSI